jgi:hypothetical protein
VPSLDELLNEVTSRALQITDGSGDPSELGVQIWSLTMARFDDDGKCVASPLHDIFGFLTDPVDWPGHEAEVPAAEAKIRLAAGDWLALAKDRKGVDRFLDRWLFEVLGWQRPWVCYMDTDGKKQILRFDGAATLEDAESDQLD